MGERRTPRGRGRIIPARAGEHLRPLFQRGVCMRIIPARAGNTPSPLPRRGRAADHHRASGEHFPVQSISTPNSGSSPRERGTRPGRRAVPARIRIIPARAGNTDRPQRTTRTEPDHPRASGEHFLAGSKIRGGVGSSPRERGTPETVGVAGVSIRIIPARAGNTITTTPTSIMKSDHPRASGEHGGSASESGGKVGSSPRERGTHLRSLGRLAGRRIIPARAGNTRRESTSRRPTADHPRASGEHASGVSALTT